MTVAGQKTWQQSIQIGGKVYKIEQESETMQMRNVMHSCLNGA